MKRHLLMASMVALSAQGQAKDLELLHWWTAGSEASMVAELRHQARQAGLPLKTSAVAGAANANTVLKTRFCQASRRQ